MVRTITTKTIPITLLALLFLPSVVDAWLGFCCSIEEITLGGADAWQMMVCGLKQCVENS